MCLLPLLCLTLSVYASATHLGYSCNIDPSNDNLYETHETIYLIREDDQGDQTWSANKQMNFEFIKACGQFYKIHQISLHGFKDFMHVIYFGFSGNDDEFINISKKIPDLQIIGDAIETTKNVTCKKTNNSEVVCDRNKKVNLITSWIEWHFRDYNVFDVIQNMIGDEDNKVVTHGRSCAPVFQKTRHLNTVVLCYEGDTDIKVYINPFKLIVKNINYCEPTLRDYDYSVLALLTPKGFGHSSVHSVPTIFYNTPYISEEDEASFPNSVNLLPWRLLKFGFLGFMRSMGWERVAIASDVSHYSIEFEHELTTLFDKEGIVYTSVKSEDSVFDVDKARQKLATVKPSIVIVNLEEENAFHLISFWSPSRPIIWIMRDMPKGNYFYKLPVRVHLYSIHLGAVVESSDCNVDANILAGLSTITHAIRRSFLKVSFTQGRRMFYKLLSNEAKKMLQEQAEAMAYVNKLSPSRELVSTMRVDDNGAKVLSFNNPYKSGKPSDGTSHCLAKSNTYSDPCEDTFVLLLMCVVILFLTTTLMITCYFHKTSPFHDPRYQNF
uniref:Receptor ligand binding region domain-containing protein n=1 Tax=Heliothis virescens TaxID=7102 RepID=A0A2A4JYQ8_HELVI